MFLRFSVSIRINEHKSANSWWREKQAMSAYKMQESTWTQLTFWSSRIAEWKVAKAIYSVCKSTTPQWKVLIVEFAKTSAALFLTLCENGIMCAPRRIQSTRNQLSMHKLLYFNCSVIACNRTVIRLLFENDLFSFPHLVYRGEIFCVRCVHAVFFIIENSSLLATSSVHCSAQNELIFFNYICPLFTNARGYWSWTSEWIVFHELISVN